MTFLWSQRFDPALRGILCSGPVVLLLAGATELPAVTGWVMMAIAVMAGLVLVFLSGVSVHASARHLFIALVPFWVHRVQLDDIIAVDLVTVRPFEDFHGWGIKGSARKDGLLFSVGGSRVVRMRTADGRVYMVSCDHDDEVVSQLQQRLADRRSIAR